MDQTAFWNSLVSAITLRGVIPVVGPGAVVVRDHETGEDVVLTDWLTPRLAQAVGLPEELRQGALNEIVLRSLTREDSGGRDEIYEHVRELLKNSCLSPAQPLVDLAAITDFQLYLSTTFDSFLSQALAAARPKFDPATIGVFHPKAVADLSAAPRGKDDHPFLYQIMGHLDSWPDFAVWDEDHMEFICELQNKAGELRRLFEALKGGSLLLIGSPFSDWIVRFFLRVAKQGRLSERPATPRDYITDDPAHMEKSMVLYFDRVVGSTTVIKMPPAEFTARLREEWEKKTAATRTKPAAALKTSPPGQRDIPDGSFFLSYAREDKEAAETFYSELTADGLVVYFDKERLQPGMNFEGSLEDAVKRQCGYFISLISPTTIHTTEAYFHKERRWAAERAKSIVEGAVFYLPVVIAPDIDPKLEPEIFLKIHYDRLPGGQTTPKFRARLKQLQEHYQRTGERPIGI